MTTEKLSVPDKIMLQQIDSGIAELKRITEFGLDDDDYEGCYELEMKVKDFIVEVEALKKAFEERCL